MSGKIRVIVVDDSALVRSLLSEIINRQSDMECIGTANDPLIAREMIREKNPDVITLDVEMPRMDGIDFLGRLMRLRPMPVVMISTLTERGAEVTMRALELGAVDFVAKPRVGLSSGLNELAAQIVDKIRVAAVAHVRRAPARSAAAIVHPDAGAATAPAPAPAATTPAPTNQRQDGRRDRAAGVVSPLLRELFPGLSTIRTGDMGGGSSLSVPNWNGALGQPATLTIAR